MLSTNQVASLIKEKAEKYSKDMTHILNHKETETEGIPIAVLNIIIGWSLESKNIDLSEAIEDYYFFEIHGMSLSRKPSNK